MSEEYIYKKALEKWGFENQRDKAIEEMSELTKAFIKERQYPSVKKTIDVVQEIADVEILMGQMRLIYGSVNIDMAKAQKLSN